MKSYEIRGVGYASILTNLSVLIMIEIYLKCIFSKSDDDFTQIENDYQIITYEGIKDYLKLGLPGVFSVSIEWWACMLMNLLSGRFGVSILAA